METRLIKDLIPWDKNPRKNKQAVDYVLESLNRHGQVKPLVLSAKGKPFEQEVVCCGHTTLLALKRFGAKEAKVVIKEFADEAQFADYAIRDNKTGEHAEWDDALLAELSGQFEIDLGEMGFDIDEMAGGTEGNTDPDDVPEVPAEPVAKLGQMWRMGNHRLMCGDSTDRAQVERLMGGDKAELVVTDPPYGVSYSDKNIFLNSVDKGNKVQTKIENDNLSKEQTQEMWKSAFSNMSEVMDSGAVVYCFMPQGGDQMMMMMMMMMAGADIEPRHELIWLKNNHVLGRVDYAYKHEPILYAWKKGGHKFYGDFQTSILEFAKPQKSDLHPTMKPVPLIEKLITNSSKANGLLYEPFSGSGTTHIACEKTGRRCYGMELSPHYCDVIIKRWQDFTGKKAELIES